MITFATGLLMAAALLGQQDERDRRKIIERIGQIEDQIKLNPDRTRELLVERDRLVAELRRLEGAAPRDNEVDKARVWQSQMQQERLAVQKADLAAQLERLQRVIQDLKASGAPEERLMDAMKQLEEARRQLETVETQERRARPLTPITLTDGAFRNGVITVDPQAEELDRKSRQIGEELHRLPATEEGKRAELKKQLATVLDELFERREKNRWKELEDLESRMKEMRKTLETRKQNKAAIVEKRAKELTGEKSDMDW